MSVSRVASVSAGDGAVLFWAREREAVAVGAIAKVEFCGGAGAFGEWEVFGGARGVGDAVRG